MRAQDEAAAREHTAPEGRNDRWPPQVKYIVGNEACERFSYYGMRSILAGYITGAVLKGGLGKDADTATTVIHFFVFANYFMPLFGAWLSDKIVGRYHTILWVSLFYCAGHGTLACSDFVSGVQGKFTCLAIGLALIAFGSGGIKPCVSAFMGDQFKPDQSHLLQKAYGAFYWSINFGSFFSFLLIPWIKDNYGYSWAFGVPGILMGLATFIFWLGTKHYVRVPPGRQTQTAGFLRVFLTAYRNHGGFEPLLNLLTTLGLPLLSMVAFTFIALKHDITPVVRGIGWAGLIAVGLWYLLVVVVSLLRRVDLPDKFWHAARTDCKDHEIQAARSVSPILFVMALIPVFWSLFDQTNSTWVLQGEKMLVFRFREFGLVASLLPYWNLVTGSLGLLALVFFLLLIFVKFRRKTLLLPIALQCLWVLAALICSGLVMWLVGYIPKAKIGAEQMQSANPALVMILVPLLTLGVYPRLGRFASPLRRMSFGMFVAALSYVIVATLQARIDAGAQLSVLWQVVPYIVLTTAEVLVSTTGLEFAFREAAPQMKSTVMSFWLLTVAFGNLLVAGITKVFSHEGAGSHEASVSAQRFMLYAGLTFVVAILFSIVAAFYRYRDPAAAQGK